MGDQPNEMLRRQIVGSVDIQKDVEAYRQQGGDYGSRDPLKSV